MALVNIVRSRGGDTHDMILYLEHINGSHTDTRTDTRTDTHIDTHIDTRVQSHPNDPTRDPKDPTRDPRDPNWDPEDSSAPASDPYCIECVDLESERIVPVQDLSGALSFNQKGMNPLALTITLTIILTITVTTPITITVITVTSP